MHTLTQIHTHADTHKYTHVFSPASLQPLNIVHHPHRDTHFLCILLLSKHGEEKQEADRWSLRPVRQMKADVMRNQVFQSFFLSFFKLVTMMTEPVITLKKRSRLLVLPACCTSTFMNIKALS